MQVADWDAIKYEYVTTKISYLKLAEKWGVTNSALTKMAVAGKWTDARKKHCKKTVDKAINKASTRQANILAKELMLADKISGVLDRALKDAEQFNRFIVTEGIGDGCSETNEKVFNKFDMRSLKEAAETLRIVEGMKMRMNNILTEPERIRFDLEKEKLAMEKARQKVGDDDDDTTGVIVLAEIVGED